MNQINEFQPFMKVCLQNEYGVVVNQFLEIDEKHFVTEIRPQVFPIKLYGLIRWDTSKVSDFEDWRGLWGSLMQVDMKSAESISLHSLMTTAL